MNRNQMLRQLSNLSENLIFLRNQIASDYHKLNLERRRTNKFHYASLFTLSSKLHSSQLDSLRLNIIADHQELFLAESSKRKGHLQRLVALSSSVNALQSAFTLLVNQAFDVKDSSIPPENEV